MPDEACGRGVGEYALGVKSIAVCIRGVLLVAAGCSSTPPAADPSTSGAMLPMSPSATERISRAERIESDVELLGLRMGQMVLDVCPADALITTTIQASPLVRLVRRLSGTATTHLSQDGLTPERSSVRVYDGDETRTYRIVYTDAGFEYGHERSSGVVERGRKDVAGGEPLYDLQSAMALLRSWRPPLGGEAYFQVVLGRHLWRAEARFLGPEMLMVSGAPRLTRRVDGVAYRVDTAQGSQAGKGASDVRRAFSLWFESDGAGYPVRLVARSTYGDVTMALSRYQQSDEFCRAHREANAASADTVE
jgi:hypothetical protein